MVGIALLGAGIFAKERESEFSIVIAFSGFPQLCEATVVGKDDGITRFGVAH